MTTLLVLLYFACEGKDNGWIPPSGGNNNGNDLHFSEDTGSPEDTDPDDDNPDDTDPDDTDPEDTNDPNNNDSGSQTLNGAELYDLNCSGCHGADGEGTGNNPNIIQALNFSNDELSDIIIYGMDAMPAINLTEDEAMAIINYMRSNF